MFENHRFEHFSSVKSQQADKLILFPFFKKLSLGGRGGGGSYSAMGFQLC